MTPLEFVASMKVFAKMNSGHEIPTRRQEKPIFNKVGNQSLTPIHGSQKYWKLIEAWSLEMSQKHVGSLRKKLRETASYVNAWMKNGTLQMYSMCLEEFAVCLFRPEMEWARLRTWSQHPMPMTNGTSSPRRLCNPAITPPKSVEHEQNNKYELFMNNNHTHVVVCKE